MALLKFNYGLLENLKNVAVSASSAGNVYITKDERAMYVDIPVVSTVDEKQVVTGAERIRIGDMRVYTYLEDLQSELSKGEQSLLTETALYYVEKQGKDKPVEEQKTVNALFKWSNAANKFIQINDTASLVSKLNELENAVAGQATAIEGINTNIEGINTNIENITKTDGIIDSKVSASAEALTALINGKVAQGDFDTLNTTVTDHIAAQATKDQGQDNLIAGLTEIVGASDNDGLRKKAADNAAAIEDIRDTIEALTGTEGGSIGEQIDAKIEAAQALQAEKDKSQDDLISGLTTDLSGYKDTVSNTYATKAELTAHEQAADAKYATKTELTAHEQAADAKYATQTALGEVSTVANRADAQASTNNTAISNLNTELTNYKTSNNTAVAEVKAVAEAAVKQSDYDAKIQAIDAKDGELAQAIAAETTRATGVEENHEERIAEIETFFSAAVDPESTIDNLNEILKYIEDHKGEAIDMAADIQKNAEDIADIKEIVGTESYTDGEGVEVPATGLIGDIANLEAGLASEVTTRVSEIQRVENYINSMMTWGTF